MRQRIVAVNVGGTATLVLARAALEGHVGGLGDGAQALGWGAVAGAGFYGSKRLAGEGLPALGLGLAVLSGSLAENAATGAGPFSHVRIPLGLADVRVRTPFATHTDSPLAAVEADPLVIGASVVFPLRGGHPRLRRGVPVFEFDDLGGRTGYLRRGADGRPDDPPAGGRPGPRPGPRDHPPDPGPPGDGAHASRHAGRLYRHAPQRRRRRRHVRRPGGVVLRRQRRLLDRLRGLPRRLARDRSAGARRAARPRRAVTDAVADTETQPPLPPVERALKPPAKARLAGAGWRGPAGEGRFSVGPPRAAPPGLGWP